MQQVRTSSILSVLESGKFILILFVSAGVFLSAGVVHLLPDAAEDIDTGFPWAYTMCGIGFLLTLIIEQVAGVWHHKRRCATDGQQHNHRHHVHGGTASYGSDGHKHNVHHLDTLHEDQTDATPFREDGEEGFSPQPSEEHVCQSCCLNRWARYLLLDKVSKCCARRNRCSGMETIQTPLTSIDKQHKLSSAEYLLGPGLVSLILALALGFHSFFAGMALGADEDNSSVRGILVAIMAHKGLAAYALTNNLTMTGASRAQLCTIVLMFSIVTPIGIIIGTVLDAQLGHGQWTSYLIAVASGVFLYVGVVELLMHELGSTHVHSHADNHVAADDVHRSRCLSERNFTSFDEDLQIPGDAIERKTGLNPEGVKDVVHPHEESSTDMDGKLKSRMSIPNGRSHDDHSHDHGHTHDHAGQEVTFKVVGTKLVTLCTGFALMSVLAIWI